MAGIFYALLAGIVVAMQGVMNTRVSDKAGVWLTNTIVHGTGFAVALAICLLLRSGSPAQLQEVPKGYLLGGAMGVLIVFSVMKAVGQLGAAYSVGIMLLSQLAFAMLIDSFGWFGSPKIPFDWGKVWGLGLMAAGLTVFKWKSF